MIKTHHPLAMPLPPRLTLRSLALAVAIALASSMAAGADPKAAQYYEDALVRFEKKDYAGAIIQLKNSLKIDDKQLSVQLLLGRSLLESGDYGAADVALNEALRLGVSRAEVVVPMARAKVGQGKPQELLDNTVLATTDLPPGIRSELLLLRASAQSDLGKAEQAMRDVEQARAIDPGAAQSYLAEVPIRIRGRDWPRAILAADKALSLVPGLADAHYLRGSIGHAQGDLGAALAAYDRALSAQPRHLEALIGKAGILMDQGQADAAASLIALAREVQPNDPRAAYLGSLLAERRGDTPAVRAALNDITNLLDPVPTEYMRYRPQLLVLGGLSHFGLGQNEKAIPYLEAVQRQQPANAVAKLLAQIQIGKRNYDPAVEVLDAYIRGNPQDAQAMSLLANAHLAQGRHGRAVQVLQAAVAASDTPALRSVLGMGLMQGGRSAEAVTELENAWRRDPKQTGAGAALVELYLGSGDRKKAIELAEALSRREPKRSDFHDLLGRARAEARDYAKARTAFELAIALSPDNNSAQINLARLDTAQGKLDAAQQRLDALLQRNETNIPALLERGLLAERRGQSDDAVRFASKAVDHSGPGQIGAGLALVDIHVRAGRAAAAVEVAKALNLKAPEALPVLMANARANLAAKDVPSARTYLTRANRAAGFNAPAQVRIATLQLGADDPKGALYSAGKALQDQPDNVPAMALQVRVFLRLGDLTEADRVAKSVVTRFPKLSVGHTLTGEVAAARDQLPVAVAAYQRAHAIDNSSNSMLRLFAAMTVASPPQAISAAEAWLKKQPRDLAMRRALADAHARVGNFAAARGGYEALLKQRPEDGELLNNLSQVLLSLKDPGALAVAERALKQQPESAHVMGTAGWAAHHAGQSDRALQLLRDARLRDPTNGETRYYLATVLASKGRHAEARTELQAAITSGRLVSRTQAQALLQSLK